MQDRTPKYPGRVALIPVPGADNIYDMVRADDPIEAGNPLSKVTFLKDATATLLGFTNPKSALPDDALKVLNATYGTCGTSSGTVAKVVVCPNFILKTGARIAVRFSATNTVNNPTLNVNGTGAIPISRYGTTSPFPYMWQAGSVVEFFYDGSRWIMTGGTTATTTYYGPTILYDGIDSTSTTMAATANSVRAAYRKIIDENINPAKITVTASQSYKLGDIVDISGNRAVSNYILTPGTLTDIVQGNWPDMSEISSTKAIFMYQTGSGSYASGGICAYTVSNGNLSLSASTTFSRDGHDGEYPADESVGNITMVGTNTAIMYGDYSNSATGPDIEEFSRTYLYKITTTSSTVSIAKKETTYLSSGYGFGGFHISGTDFVSLRKSGSSYRIAKRTYNITDNIFSEGTAYTFSESGDLSVLHAFTSTLFLILKAYNPTSSSATQYIYQVRDVQGTLKSSITVPDSGEKFKTVGVSATKAILLRYDGVAYIITISSTGVSITLSDPIKVFNRTATVVVTDAIKKDSTSALYAFRMNEKIYITEISTDGTFVEPLVFVQDGTDTTGTDLAMVGSSLVYTNHIESWGSPAPMIQGAVATQTNNNSEGLIMSNVSSGQQVDVCLDGNMKWASQSRGTSIDTPIGERVAYCYTDGLVNVIGKWKRKSATSSSSSGSDGLPAGTIIMWSGTISDIPSGFALCDGTNGTPNLRNRFIVGAGDSYNVGATGGQKDIKANSSYGGYRYGDHYVLTSVSTENRPPYYALAYIMKV